LNPGNSIINNQILVTSGIKMVEAGNTRN